MSRPIDKEFEDADDTGVLDISGRNLRQFPVVPGDLLDLTYVFEADLSSNRFDKVPKELIGCKALVKLNCHHNSIRWLPPELNLLLNLREIDMSRNFLPDIPREICHMNLYAINLSNNRLLSIPNDIGCLKKVQFLDLSCNSLKELPESLYTLGNLRHLNLHRNQLQDLSNDICQLSELHYLNVSCNFLCHLPVSLRHMQALQEFTADGNPLEYPPPQVCLRGLVHLCKYLEVLEKKGSDHHLFQSYQRDESLRRRNERAQKKTNSLSRPISMSTPVRNGDDNEIGLLDEMANLVNRTFGEKDGQTTPTGSLHWSVAQFMSSAEKTSKSKEDYRDATHRLYLQQEGHKGRPPDASPTSPAGSTSSLDELSTTPTSTLPKRKSDENVYRSSTGDSSQSRNFVGRSLSNEKFPRSGSWNSHIRKTSPVLPSKYVAPDRASEEKSHHEPKKSPPANSGGSGLSSKSESNLGSMESPPIKKATKATSSPKKSNKRPPPLDTSKAQNGEKGTDSDHEGSLTPTNESPPILNLDEPTTPKDDETFDDMLNSESPDNAATTAATATKATKSVSLNSQVEVIPPSTRKTKPLPLPPTRPRSTSSLPLTSPDIEITELERSPTSSLRRLPSLSEESQQAKADKDKVQVPDDNKWQRLTSPRKKKEKDVFKFLKENDANYTVRRQQMQINIMLEKNQHVKKMVENLVGVQLSDDLGEWVMDGVILCKVINTLHPGTIATIHTTPPGQALSRIKQTINISAFIDACKLLKVPEEELCSAGDIVELKDPLRVITCLQRVLETKPGNLV